MSYITTVTGKHFDPMDPGNHDFNIVDIAHALSLICRGNGHIRFFYSVAQHSIACAEEAVARGYSPEVILGCLLHDASEAYLSDVTRPVKTELPQYLIAEEKLQRAIWQHFIGRDLTADEMNQIFEETAYVRTGGSAEEKKCAAYIKEKCKAFGLTATEESFEVEIAEISEAKLVVNGKEIPCKGYLCAGSSEVEAPLYYLTNTDKYSLSCCNGKIVMIDGYLGYWKYRDIAMIPVCSTFHRIPR